VCQYLVRNHAHRDRRDDFEGRRGPQQRLHAVEVVKDGRKLFRHAAERVGGTRPHPLEHHVCGSAEQHDVIEPGVKEDLVTGSALYEEDSARVLYRQQRVDPILDPQLFAVDVYAEVEATWTMYQRCVAAYREPDRKSGAAMMAALITTLSADVPKPLTELITLGRTLTRRVADVLAYFDRPGTSNGPTEAISGRLEHRGGSALGFRNLTNYIARSLLETGGFKPQLHRQS
jgi:hypothetical protein